MKKSINDVVAKLTENRFDFISVSLHQLKENLLRALDVFKLKALDVLYETDECTTVLTCAVDHFVYHFLTS